MGEPTIVIIGAGGHAKVLLDALLGAGQTVQGLLDADASRHGTSVLGKPVLGDDSWLETAPPQTLQLVNGLGSNGLVTAKRSAFERAKAAGYTFATVQHPAAVVGRDVALGEGAQLLARAVVEAGSKLGANVTINTGAIVNHDCRLGDHVHVAPGAVVLGGVEVGEATHVGASAVILTRLKIGRDCVIGAGAVVVKNLPDGSTVAGVPATQMEQKTR
jgi:sugar O-acyltransferase (sialic acid O-acetyltransferase NeuD family)